MNSLGHERCVPCKGDAPRASDEETKHLMATLPQWEIADAEGVPRLVRTFTFNDWSDAIRFTNDVGQIAEEEGHHPAILTEWGKVTVSWWTHKIKGLHRNDFIMAAKTDALLGAGLSAQL